MLVWALIFVVVTSGMVVSHSIRMASSRRELDTMLDRRLLARTVAKSGVVDALSWFRSQPTQPVSSFAPLCDPYGDPPRMDTIDAAMGLVRDFEIRGNLWGRYELRRTDMQDVTGQRGMTGTGKAWAMQARSYVYRVVDPGKPFDQAPNRIVAMDTVATEICKFGMSIPASAPVIAQDPEALFVYENVVINGGSGAAVVYGNGPLDAKDYTDPVTTPVASSIDGLAPAPISPIRISVDPVFSVLATLTGTTSMLRQPSLALDLGRIFGTRPEDLRAFADIVVSDGSGLSGLKEVSGKVVFIAGDLQIDQGVNLDGTAIVVYGSLGVPINPTPTKISGVIYVEGDAKILGNFTLDGVLIVKHTLSLGTSGGGPDVVINSSPPTVTALQSELRAYRLRRGSLSE